MYGTLNSIYIDSRLYGIWSIRELRPQARHDGNNRIGNRLTKISSDPRARCSGIVNQIDENQKKHLACSTEQNMAKGPSIFKAAVKAIGGFLPRRGVN